MMRTLLVACGLSAVIAARGIQAASARFDGPEQLRGDVEHGRYLVEHVAMCGECHSPRNDTGEIIEGREFLGAPVPVGPPSWEGDWAVRAPRIQRLPGYDDALALRLLTEGGIGRDGRQLRPPMPPFRMSEQDASDVIAYLRSVE